MKIKKIDSNQTQTQGVTKLNNLNSDNSISDQT